MSFPEHLYVAGFISSFLPDVLMCLEIQGVKDEPRDFTS